MSAPWSRSRGHISVIICVMILFSFFSISESMAAIPRKISYQGVLTDSSGTPLSDGQYQMKFQLYTSASGGTLLWTEEWKDSSKVTVNNGLFNALLGSIEPINLGTLTFSVPYWLQVEVYNTGSSSYETLSPRHQLASAAYALRAATVEDGAISESALASNSVTAEKIGAGVITDTKVDSLSASKITTGTINNDRINWAAPGNIGTTTAGVGYFTNLFASGNVLVGSGGNTIGLYRNTAYSEPYIKLTGGDGTNSFYFQNRNNTRLDVRYGTGDPSNLLTIANSGNVGIGTTEPGAKFHVVGTEADPAIVQSNASTYTGLNLKNTHLNGAGSSVGWSVLMGTRAIGGYDSLQPGNFAIRQHITGNNFYRFIIGDSGNVGIGTMSPSAKLHVEGGGVFIHCDDWGDSALLVKGQNELYGFRPTYYGLDLYHHNTAKTLITFNKSGNVGIGKTPGYKLDVAGTIRGEQYSCPNGDIAEKLPVHPDYELSSKELKNKVSKLNLPDAEKKAMIERKEISKLEPGTVVVISKGGVVPCAKENDTCLAGIISTSPAVKMAAEEKGQYIALAGKVPCKVTGKIKTGDMLTTSAIEGRAQKAEQPVLGAVVGKALEDFDGERGVVDVWVGGM